MLKAGVALLLSSLLVPPALADKGPGFDDPRINAMIEKAYHEQVEKAFLRIANSAKRHDTAIAFVQAILPLPEAHPDRIFLMQNLGDVPAPKIFSVKNGIKLTLEKFAVTLTKGTVFGTIEIDGKAVDTWNAKGLKAEIEADNKTVGRRIFNMIFPEADAVGPIGQLAWAGIKTAAKWALAGAVGGAAVGGVGGCGMGMHAKDDMETFLDACLGGAKVGAAMLSGFAGIVYGGGGMGYGAADGWGNMSEAEKNMVNSKVFKPMANVFKAAGVLGVVAAAIHGGEELLTMNGARLNCSRDGGYAVDALKGGVARPLYSYYGGEIMVKGKSIGEFMVANVESIDAHLKKIKMPADKAKVLAQAIMKEHNDRVAYCKRNPGRTTKTIKNESGALLPAPMSEKPAK